MKYIFSLVTLFLAVILLQAQTGPGGVGNKDGSNGQPSNVIWFDASRLSLSNNDNVATWTDFSGNNNNGIQPSTANQPIFLTGQINGLPAVYFDNTGSPDFMPFDGNLIANKDYTVIAVTKRRSNSSFKIIIGGSGNSSNTNLHLFWNSSSAFHSHHYGNDYNNPLVPTAQPYSGGTNVNTYGIFTSLLSSSLPSDQRKHYQNNYLLGTRSNNAKLTSYNNAAIARYLPNNTYSDIDVAEFIIYSNALNSAQLQIVHQYLNVKYNINIYNDLYDPVAPYVYDVAGIGKVDASNEHTNASSAGLYLTSLSGVSNGDFVFTSHNNANNSPTYFTNADLPSGVELRYNRIWYVSKTGNPTAQIAFDFSETTGQTRFPQNHTNYVLLYRSGTSGNFSVVENAEGISNGDRVYFNLDATQLQNGYYTLGTQNNTDSPLEGITGRTWYTLISGDWDNWEIWTLDPSGALPNNPDMLTPTTSPTANADKVVILNGKTVTLSTNNKLNDEITVIGRLDINTTTGHSFSKIKGNGRILLKGDNFPAGDATFFVTKELGGGTVVYQTDGTVTNYNLNTARTFYNVEIDLQDVSHKVVLRNNYTINGNLVIKKGNLQINDNTNQKLNITIYGNLTVNTDGQISVGTGNTTIGGDEVNNYHAQWHQLTVYGDFTNDGIVKFTNQTAPVYDAYATNGAVTLIMAGETNSTMLLNNTTWLYNLVVDKGTDKTYILEIISSAYPNFVLFGRNNIGRNSPSPYSPENPQVRKALFIKNGTLKLSGNIHIPTLSEGNAISGNGDWAIGKNGRLWIAGQNVIVYTTASATNQIPGFETSAVGVNTTGSNQALSLYGEFKITNGFFGTRNSAGFIFWSDANSQVKIEGGTVNVSQLRSAYGGGGVASYIQSGGTMIVRGRVEPGEVSDSYPIFGFDDPSNVFIMTGGEILIKDVSGHTENGFYIPADEGNYSVNGGKLTIEVNGGKNVHINSTAPVWNFEIKRLNSSGITTAILKKDFTVLNNLTINNNTVLEVQDPASEIHNLYVGGNFDLQSGGQYNCRTNTTYFISNRNTIIYARDNSVAAPLKFYNLVIDKDRAFQIGVYRTVSLGNTGRSTDPNNTTNTAIEILNDFTIVLGKFNTYRYRVFLRRHLQIDEGEITYDATNPGRITLNGSTQQNIKGSLVYQYKFGNIELNNSNGAKLLTSATFNNFFLNVGIMDINEYNLQIDGSLSTTGTYSASLMIRTSGDAGNGGLTRFIDLATGVANTEHIFPVGSPAGYSPAWVIQSATINKSGYYTIKPVDTYHPMFLAGYEEKTIPYYWVVKTSGFTNLLNTDVKYTFESPVQASASANKGAWYDYSIWDWDEQNNVVDSRKIVRFNYGHAINGDFTIGNKSIFKKPKVYFTRDYDEQPDWTNVNTWTEKSLITDINGDGQINYLDWHDRRQPPAGDYPKLGDIAVIGWVPWTDPNVALRGMPHSARWNSGNLQCAEIIFTQMRDPDGNPTARKYRNNFQFRPTFTINSIGTMTIGRISGEGIIRVRDANNIDPSFANIDLGDFVSEDSAYFLYEGFAAAKTYNNSPNKFPNLFISNDGWGANDKDITINKDFVVYGNMEVRGNANYVLPTGSVGNIEIFGDLIVEQAPVNTGGAEFAFGNTGNSRTVYVHGNIRLGGADAKIWVRNPAAPNLVVMHNLFVEGNIYQNTSGTNDLLRFWTADDQDVITLHLVGKNDAQYLRTSGNAPRFYRIIMNKESAGLVTFSFNSGFTLHGPTNTPQKAIELISGRLGLRNSSIDVVLTSGGGDFKIPQEAILWLGEGTTARVSGTNTGIWLDGAMQIGNNVQALFNQGDNNYIEYTSSGKSEIYIYGTNCNFLVGSQIRRSEYTEEGILKFRLTSSTANVKIGVGNNIPSNNRGVFEILNNGSYLEMTDNSKIIIANAQNNVRFPTLYLAPSTYILRDGSTFQFGTNETRANQYFGLYSDIPLQNLSIVNNSLPANPKLKIWTKDIVVNQNINIGNGTLLNADGWNITIKGNWTNNGNFSANGNTVYFGSSNTQAITGQTTFYNFEKNQTNLLNVNSNITVENEFKILGGSLADNSNEITVKGNLTNNGIHIYGGSGDGIIANGTLPQELISAGEWGKLTINNPQGVFVNTTYLQIKVNNALKLINGVFDIGGNLLVMNQNAIFIEGNPFSANNMVRTRLSFTDNGIKKYFNSSFTGQYTFPIGSGTKYTPVILSNVSMTNGGSLRVKAADEIHPTIVGDLSVTDCDARKFAENNVLQYHWTLDADNGLSGFNANVSMKFIRNDAKYTPPYSLDDYITAKLILGTTEWNKFGHETVDKINNLLLFEFINSDASTIDGDYTAGVQYTTDCGAIPDQIPAYISVNNGNWTNKNNWATYNLITHAIGNPGENVPTGGPRGSIAIIDAPHRIIMDQNYIRNYKTTINGVLDAGTTFGQRIGYVDGVGELYIERGDLPAAVYDDFVLPNTGTFHFGGNYDYDILSNIPIVNNLKVSGTGQRRLPNMNIILRGHLTIDGTNSTLVLINEHNRKTTVYRDITFNEGSFVAGTGSNAIFEIGGSQMQYIKGTNSFTSSNAFNHFQMNNSAGLTLNKPIDISQTITFTNGIIFNTNSSVLTLTNTSNSVVIGAGTGKFVDGVVAKMIVTNDGFTFPIGNTGRYGYARLYNIQQSNGVEKYFAQYYNDNPLNGGMDPELFASPLQYVSHNEYWRFNGAPGTSANILLRWDALSGASDVQSERDDMRIAQWITANNRWEQAHTNNTASGTQSSGTITTEPTLISLNGDKFFTLSTKTVFENVWEGDISTDWNVAGNWSLNRIPTASTNATIPTNPIGNRFPVVSTTANVLNLTINSNATLTVNPGAFFTSYGTINNNGQFILKSPNNKNASASLIDNGITGTGVFKIERYITPNEYHYVSSPIQIGGNATSALFTRTNPSGYYNPNFYKYNEAYDLDGNPATAPGGSYNQGNLSLAWEYAHNGPTGSDEVLQPKKGYAFYTDLPQVITFQGLPNTGNMNITGLSYTNNDPLPYQVDGNGVPQLYDGWHLVGNPYPSAIDWDLVKNSLTNIDEGIYVWDGTQYANYVNGIPSGAGTQNNIILPMQGFFIRTNAPNAGFLLNNSHRVHNNTQTYKNNNRQKSDKDRLLTISINANGYTSVSNIYFDNSATVNYDGKYDALAMFSYLNEVPDLYTIGKNGIKYSTNCLPTTQIGNTSVPLGLRLHTPGNYTLNFEFTAGFDTLQILLQDKENNTFTDIKTINSYTFSHNGTDNANRFVIHFVKNNPPQLYQQIERINTLEDQPFSWQIPHNTFIDYDFNDTVYYSANGTTSDALPKWLSFDNHTLTLSGTPTNDDIGYHNIQIVATDRFGASASTSFTIQVINTNDKPIVQNQLPDVVIKAYEELFYPIPINTFCDIDPGDKLTLSIYVKGYNQLPSFISFNQQNNTIFLAPTNDDAGQYDIIVRATDLSNEFAETSFTLTVKEQQILNLDDNIIEVKVKPNPSEGIFHIHTPYAKYDYEITDVTGKVVLRDQANSRRQTIDLTQSPAGTYFLRLRLQDNTVITKQLIKY